LTPLVGGPKSIYAHRRNANRLAHYRCHRERLQSSKLHSYAVGSCGPAEADKMLAADGREWYPLGFETQ